ncbi:MAG: zinc ABC transporter permease subunit ZnuB [Kistimonas sp.]|nr:zinc ABC transporter permease subunit ZnuB [Kistimonas sp.]
MIDLLLYPLLVGLGVAAVCGPLGSFVVWRRMAYFGETLSHSALLGVTMGLLFEINPDIAVIISSLLLAVALVCVQRKWSLATDSLLGILAHSSLSLGLVALSLSNVRLDVTAWLFGDLLAVGRYDLYRVLIGGAIILALLCRFWRPLLSMTVHKELAAVEGVAVKRLELLLMLMLAVVIAVAMRTVGALLITSLLIIPAATAERLARSPEQMAVGASLLGMLAIMAGLWASLLLDTPAGPSVVVCSTLLFVLSWLAAGASTRR